MMHFRQLERSAIIDGRQPSLTEPLATVAICVAAWQVRGAGCEGFRTDAQPIIVVMVRG
jgi:hypothetical protein